jgi:segregation and condensation protein B
MSLKAKLEAVIYAAEEPVTLAQLALLFTADALEWKAEQQAAAANLAADTTLPGDESSSPQNGEFDYSEPPQQQAPTEPEAASGQADAETSAQEPTPPDGEDSALGEAAEDSRLSETALAQAADDTADPAPNGETEAALSDEAAAQASLRREARQRDREVRAILRQLLDELIAEYVSDDRGVEIREIAGGYRMATKPECHDAVRAFVKALKPALRLSLPALETLAVVAYKQPVTAPEVNEIRGVDSSGVFGSLLARKLIATAGRKPVIGRPILYKTTKEFLLRFGLKDVNELPSMEEFEKMAAMELDEPELADPERDRNDEPAPQTHEDLSLETDATEVEEPAGEPTKAPDAEAPAPSSDSTTPEAAPAAPPPTE